jgi:hypothetical protein
MTKKPRNLTDLFIASLKPAPKGERASFADTQVPGLKVRVTDKGAKSFVLCPRRAHSFRSHAVVSKQQAMDLFVVSGARSSRDSATM